MSTLFLLDPVIKQKPAHRCRGCKYMITHEYNSGFKYCTQKRSSRTDNGYRKIKANDPACPLFESNKS